MLEDHYIWSRQAEEWSLARYVVPSDLPKEFILTTEVSFLDLDNEKGKIGVLEYLYEMVKNQKIKYALTDRDGNENPDHFQYIRKPGTILRDQRGTCLDLAVLFAAMALKNELLPVIIFLKGHAFIGVSQKRTLRTDHEATQVPKSGAWKAGKITDLKKLLEIQKEENEFIFIECTGAAQGKSLSELFPEGRGRDEDGWMDFKRACEAGREQLNNLAQSDGTKAYRDRAFRYALDIYHLQRQHGVKPAKDTVGAIVEGLVPHLSEVIAKQNQQAFQEFRPKPQFKDLFATITDPEQIPLVLFHSDATKGMVPHLIDHVKQREGVESVQEVIDMKLMDSGGRLLLQGRSGIGKTREVAELAKTWCENGWTVCVGKNQGEGDDPDAQLDVLASFPKELGDARLLVILDDLHLRIQSNGDEKSPYMERLERFLTFLENHLTPDRLFVILILPSEPQFQKKVGLDPTRKPWNRFKSYSIPEFTINGLRQMLVDMAAKADVIITDDIARLLVDNCDRSPATLFDNVRMARRRNQPLSEKIWQPSKGLSWQKWFLFAKKEYPEAETVYQSIHLLREAGLKTRKSYVHRASRQLARSETITTLDGLIDMGLLSQRQDILTFFSEEQLVESLNAANTALLNINDYWDHVIQWIRNSDDIGADPLNDQTRLAFSLLEAKKYDLAKDVASYVISEGADSAQAYSTRGVSCFFQKNWSESEKDLNSAIELDPEDGRIYRLRGSVRFILGKFGLVIEDLTASIEHGQADADVYGLRGMGRFSTKAFNLAEEDFTEALNNNQKDSTLWLYMRALTRWRLKNDKGAEEDFSEVLSLGGIGWNLPEIATSPTQDKLDQQDKQQDVAAEGSPLNGYVHYARAEVRMSLGQFEGAEADFTKALEQDISATLASIDEILSSDLISPQNKSVQEYADFRAQTPDEQVITRIYLMRGAARLEQKKYQEAEEDSTKAIECGLNEPDVYLNRGIARFHLQRFPDAVNDFSTVIQMSQNEQVRAKAFYGLGLALYGREPYSEAETAFDNAIASGMNDPDVYVKRGSLRQARGNLIEAEDDYSIAIDGGLRDAYVYFARGVVRFGLQRFGDAIADFSEAINKRFDNADVFFQRGIAYRSQGKVVEAEADFTEAINREKTDAVVYLLRGAARRSQGKSDEAKRDFVKAQAQGEGDPRYHVTRAEVFIEQGKFSDAEKDLSTAIDLGMDNAYVYFLRCDARLKQEKFEDAERDAEEAIARGMNDRSVYFNRGSARFFLSKYAEAETDFDRAIEYGYDELRVRVYRGLARIGNGKFAEAENDFTVALSYNPDNQEIFYDRGLSRNAQADWAGAEADYADAMQRGKTDAELFRARAINATHLNDLKQAEDYCIRASELAPNESSTNRSWGLLQLAQEDFENGISSFQAELDADEAQNWGHFYKGLALLLAGQLDEAREEYKAAMAKLDSSNHLEMAYIKNEFNFGTTKHSGRLVSPEAKQALEEIREILARLP